MNLVVDAGNSSVKCFVFEKEDIVAVYRYSYDDLFAGCVDANLKKNFEKGIVSNVSKYETQKLISCFSIKECCDFNHKTTFPILISYKEKDSLGLDRIAAAIGAEVLYPNEDKLIVDFGTAITIDFVDRNATFVGGNISLGLHSRIRALHEFTGKLPEIEIPDSVELIGKTTNEAIQYGVVNGIIFEIEEYIRIYESKNQDVRVIFTGGDCLFFEKRVKSHIFAHPNLVAVGLRSLIK